MAQLGACGPTGPPLQLLWNLPKPPRNRPFDQVLDQRVVVGIYIGVELLIGLLNTFSVRLLDVIGEVSGEFESRTDTWQTADCDLRAAPRS